jgi:hypothetical protein
MDLFLEANVKFNFYILYHHSIYFLSSMQNGQIFFYYIKKI